MDGTRRGYIGVWTVVLVIAVLNLLATPYAPRLGWSDVLVVLASGLVALIALLMLQDEVRRR